MTMNQSVFRSILAMDSYNRGYGAGVRITPAGTSPINTGIGTATIVNDSTEAIGLGVIVGTQYSLWIGLQ
jgi:hypothetical protein